MDSKQETLSLSFVLCEVWFSGCYWIPIITTIRGRTMQAFSQKCAFEFLQARSDLIGNIHLLRLV